MFVVELSQDQLSFGESSAKEANRVLPCACVYVRLVGEESENALKQCHGSAVANLLFEELYLVQKKYLVP